MTRVPLWHDFQGWLGVRRITSYSVALAVTSMCTSFSEEIPRRLTLRLLTFTAKCAKQNSDVQTSRSGIRATFKSTLLPSSTLPTRVTMCLTGIIPLCPSLSPLVSQGFVGGATVTPRLQTDISRWLNSPKYSRIKWKRDVYVRDSISGISFPHTNADNSFSLRWK